VGGGGGGKKREREEGGKKKEGGSLSFPSNYFFTDPCFGTVSLPVTMTACC